MVPLLMSLRGSLSVHGIPMERFYSYVGISRQGFSRAAQRYKEECRMVGEFAVLVKSYRLEKDRRAGSRSVFHNLGIKSGYGIGTNKFERLMSSNGLVLPALNTRIVTTKSSMQSWNYPNLLNGLTINDINMAVVGDLTYINICGRRYFLFCLTDIYSARIVGSGFGESMRAEDAKSAQDQWVGLRGKENLMDCIHHTDGGTQYFSALYLGGLNKLGVRVSCAKNCLMNGYAEQRNGLIKHHLVPTIKASEKAGLKRKFERIIHVYNYERKQEGLGWLSPVEFEEKILGLSEKPGRILYDFGQNKNGF